MTFAPTTHMVSGAASTLLADVIARPLVVAEVARTRTAVHYDTGLPDVPVLCVATQHAVRLPNAVVTASLPAPSAPRPTVLEIRVTRWWDPPRPAGLLPPPPARLATLGPSGSTYGVLEPLLMLGRGTGLTPEGDDVLAGALVTAAATADPRLTEWRRATREALARHRTTAVSRGLLTHALDGYATPELAALLTALCAGGDLDAALRRLLVVGHTSGRALLDGVRLTLTTRTMPTRSEGAA